LRETISFLLSIFYFFTRFFSLFSVAFFQSLFFYFSMPGALLRKKVGRLEKRLRARALKTFINAGWGARAGKTRRAPD
jgi:hypothetical protein